MAQRCQHQTTGVPASSIAVAAQAPGRPPALSLWRRPVIWLLAVAVIGCDLGGGGGGGPADPPLPKRRQYTPEHVTDAVARGAELYSQWGCALCHGEAGKGGVANPNSETGGEIVGLTRAKAGYSAEQLHARIAEGVPEVGRKGGTGPIPPLRMPAYGAWLDGDEIEALGAYVFSLFPKDEEASGDDWDDEDEEGGDIPAPVTAAVPAADAATPAATVQP